MDHAGRLISARAPVHAPQLPSDTAGIAGPATRTCPARMLEPHAETGRLCMKTVLAALLLSFGLLLFAPPYDRADADHATLMGTVTLNGKIAPADVQINARSTEDVECGTFTTTEGGGYELAVSEDCARGSSVSFVLAKTGEQAASDVSIEGGEQTATIAFEGLSDETLQEIGALQPTPPPVVQEPSAPLSGRDLYVVVAFAVMPAMILLGMMVWGSLRQKDAPKNGNGREV